jgi:predicted dehydrogenase
MRKIHWGILGTARIGTHKVIPAMQKGQFCHVSAIASRDLKKARRTAEQLKIAKFYGSYQELLADPEIDAVYNPLPNHLHVPLTIEAIHAGKHVLCEKPIALSAAEASSLLEVTRKYPQIKVMEAFMYRHHPQWQTARQMVLKGKIGKLESIQSVFSYFNDDPDNIRNKAEIGGGGLMDIGCYCISLSRFIFAAEPEKVCGQMVFDPSFKTDLLCNGILIFPDGGATFTCATQMMPFQRVNIFGTKGRIEIEIPFNAPVDKPCRIFFQNDQEFREISFPVCDQYTIQGDLFSESILNNRKVPTPLEDAVANMQVIEKIRLSEKTGKWIG